MSIIFGYEKILKNKIQNNGFKFVNNRPPINLGFSGCWFKNLKIHESVIFNEEKLDKYLKKVNIKIDETLVEKYENYSFLTWFFDIKIKQLDKINDDDKYYFPIDIMNIGFFNNVEQASNLHLPEKVISDIKNKKSKILVLFCLETPFIKNIYKIFRSWSKKFNIPMDSIVFSSGDYSLKKYKNINYIPFSVFEHWMRRVYNNNKISSHHIYIKRRIQTKTKRPKIFLNYNRRPTFKRCQLVYKLQQQDLFKHGLVSLGWKRELLEDHVINNFPDDFLNTLPITFDDSDLYVNLAETLVLEDFMNTYVSLVSESLVEDKIIFPTEKIWKPIIFYHPFIVISEVGFLEQLRKFGYKTFSDWFDESYDKELNQDKRLDMVINEIKKLTKMTHEELQDMLHEMMPILKHNFKTYMSRSKSQEFQLQLQLQLQGNK